MLKSCVGGLEYNQLSRQLLRTFLSNSPSLLDRLHSWPSQSWARRSGSSWSPHRWRGSVPATCRATPAVRLWCVDREMPSRQHSASASGSHRAPSCSSRDMRLPCPTPAHWPVLRWTCPTEVAVAGATVAATASGRTYFCDRGRNRDDNHPTTLHHTQEFHLMI